MAELPMLIFILQEQEVWWGANLPSLNSEVFLPQGMKSRCLSARTSLKMVWSPICERENRTIAILGFCLGYTITLGSRLRWD